MCFCSALRDVGWREDFVVEATLTSMYHTFIEVKLLQKHQIESEWAMAIWKAFQKLWVYENNSKKKVHYGKFLAAS